MSEHMVKCWPAYYDAIERGDKTFDVRRDDRGYQKGDTLSLHRYEIGFGYHTGCILKRQITYVLTGGQFGIEPGFVVLALSSTPRNTAAD